MTAISIVIPVYNSEKYLQRFVASLQAQTFTDFEALFVDDASTDGGAELLSGLAAADPRLKLLTQPKNLGAGAARNAGIRAATGETLCCADPDDVLPENSLHVRYAAFKKYNAIVRACHDELSETGALIQREKHPTGQPYLCVPREAAARFGVNHFVSAHWTWLFPTRLLQQLGIFYAENMRTAEDVMLLTRLFFKTERLVWLPDTVYHWVKHDQSLSTTRYSFEHYADYLRCVDVFYEEAEKNQGIALADWLCDDYLRAYLPHCVRQCLIGKSTEDALRLVILAADICARHNTFARFADDANGAAYYAGLTMLRHTMEGTSPSLLERLVDALNAAHESFTTAQYVEVRRHGVQLPVHFDRYDPRQQLFRVRYQFCGEEPEERFTYAGRPFEAAFAKTKLEHQGKDFTVFERIVWLPVPAGNEGLLELRLDGREAGLCHSPEDLRRALAPAPLSPIDEQTLPVEARVLRKFVKSPAAHRFQDAWLFMDRDTDAEDNAEHLYRWVTKHHPEINAWFVLAEDSHDWPRLAAEGFKLVAAGSMEHKALFILCKNLISSHMDRYIFALLEEEHFADLRDAKFICLQHGVIKDDISPWLNPIPIDLFVVTTHDEYASIVNDGTAYVMTAKEVCLSGLPRHDQLVEPLGKEKLILVMPTWRSDLVGAWDGKGQKREINPTFHSSPYVALWREFFEDTRLKALADAYGYRVAFLAHPCFTDYLPGMPFPDYVEKYANTHVSLQSMKQRSSLLITDFTSVAFDMAYMRRPLIYYQPESGESFVKRQHWAKGYFDYTSMGFGPVCADRDALFAALEESLRDGCVMPALYAARVDTTFPWRDANCCRRIFECIVAGSQPFVKE